MWPIDIIHGAAIVGEEAGEVLKAALQHTYESKEYGPCLDEAIHTAVTAMRFISAHLYGDMDNRNNKQI